MHLVISILHICSFGVTIQHVVFLITEIGIMKLIRSKGKKIKYTIDNTEILEYY
jgi:hypothetical protein